MLNSLSNKEKYCITQMCMATLDVCALCAFRWWKLRLKDLDVRLITHEKQLQGNSSTCGIAIWIKSEQFMSLLICC